MRQIPAGELNSYLNWFRTLPLWLDLDGLRVVHACWDEHMIEYVEGRPVTNDFLVSACLEGGFLCAYRWDGEQELDAGKFVWTV